MFNWLTKTCIEMQLNENPFNAIALGQQTTDYNSRRITISNCTYKISSSSSYTLLEVSRSESI